MNWTAKKQKTVKFGLVACVRESGLDHNLIITKDFEKVEVVDGIRINFKPLWKWLLRLSGNSIQY